MSEASSFVAPWIINAQDMIENQMAFGSLTS